MKQEAPAFHTPVLGPETAARVVWDPQGIYVDATVGGGGHAEHLLERMGDAGRLIGIDRDPEAVRAATVRLRRFGNRAEVVQAPFWNLRLILNDLRISRIAGVLFDLGLSSYQIDRPERGFSYRQDGPLDMRMSPDAPRSAREIINTYSQGALARIFKLYGEERASARIARAICQRRNQKRFEQTSELADLIADVVRGPHLQKTLARIFQAVRIEVNEELVHLQEALEGAIETLRPAGRIAVLSYHSLEDRTVKQVFRDAVRGCICPPNLPACGCGRMKTLKLLTSRGIRAGDAEKQQNPRARSATLRVAKRLEGEGVGD